MRRLWIVSVILALLWGCLDFTKEEPKKKEHIKVNLPSRPSFDIKHPPKHYVDGSYSVEGLLKDMNVLKGKTVTVTGYVISRVLCPENQDVVCNIEPSIVLADYNKGLSRNVQVFALSGHESDLAAFKEGERVKLRGKLSMNSPRGTVVALTGVFILEPTEKKAEEKQTKKDK